MNKRVRQVHSTPEKFENAVLLLGYRAQQSVTKIEFLENALPTGGI